MNARTDLPGAALVLNVDDDETARYVKTRILRQAGFAVREATYGAQALELARAEHPGVVLLDVRLPDISGIEVCRRLNADPATADILVLQTSASLVGIEDRVRGLQGGADHYLAQPFSADELALEHQPLARHGHRAAQRAQKAQLVLGERLGPAPPEAQRAHELVLGQQRHAGIRIQAAGAQHRHGLVAARLQLAHRAGPAAARHLAAHRLAQR